MEDTVKRLEEETVRIEQEAKNTEITITSETSKKVNKEVKDRKTVKQTKIKKALKKRIEKLTKIVEQKEKKIETNTKKIIETTKKISQTGSTLTKVTTVHEKSVNKQKYASCSRMIMEQPSYFDLNTICSVTMTSSSSTTSYSSSGKSTTLTPQSLTCQMCYAQKPACTSGAAGAGVSVVAFSVDSQGEAEALTSSLKSSRKIADINYISAQVNRKYLVNGQMTSDPSQVRVQVITTDAKAQQVVDSVTQWRQTNQKMNKGLENDAIVTPLTGASSEYIASVVKSTQFTAVAYQTRDIPREMRTMMVAQVDSQQPQNLAQSSEGLASDANQNVQAGESPMDSFISGFY